MIFIRMRNICLFYVLSSLTLLPSIAWGQNEKQENRLQQEEGKGSFLTFSGHLGGSSIKYTPRSLGEKGNHSPRVGFGLDAKYSYFFDAHWGATTGLGFQHFGSTGKLKGNLDEDKFYDLGTLTDNDFEGRPRDFDLRARVTNLEERQTFWLFEVPFLVNYQFRFKDTEECWGMYTSLGVKLQLPLKTKFRIQRGSRSEFNVSGQYDGIPTDMGSPLNPPVPQHGFGTITNPNGKHNWDDKIKLKMGVTLAAEVGAIYRLNEERELLFGLCMDYGLTDIQKNGDQGLFSAPATYHPHADNNIGNGITYNGMLNSNITNKVRLFSLGAKIAVRFKL